MSGELYREIQSEFLVMYKQTRNKMHPVSDRPERRNVMLIEENSQPD